jgi:acylphosphatase
VTRFRAIIGGRVQGVGYRASAAHQARRSGLQGWVRNRPDGMVEVDAQGDETVLQTFLIYLRQGPPGARVKSVDVEWLPVALDLGSFEIR